MSSLSLRDPQVIGALAAAVLCAGGTAAWFLLRKRPTEEEIERVRREELVKSGRIIDGTVIDISDLNPEECGRPDGLRLILYKYAIAGVVYECSQDVTYLRHWINLHSCRLGLHTSVKYDPLNPGNSLVVSENWMGLRQ